MLTLGIDTAGRVASCALLEDATTIGMGEQAGPHSAALAPMIARLLDSRGARAADLALIGVAVGPGSYTGLRVGVVTAKVLGWAARVPVVSVPTLDAMASRAPAEARSVIVVLHAYKRRVVEAAYRREGDGRLVGSSEARLVRAEDLRMAQDADSIVTDAADLVALPARATRSQVVAVSGPSGEVVARLASSRFRAGAPDEGGRLEPIYLLAPSITLRGARAAGGR